MVDVTMWLALAIVLAWISPWAKNVGLRVLCVSFVSVFAILALMEAGNALSRVRAVPIEATAQTLPVDHFAFVSANRYGYMWLRQMNTDRVYVVVGSAFNEESLREMLEMLPDETTYFLIEKRIVTDVTQGDSSTTYELRIGERYVVE